MNKDIINEFKNKITENGLISKHDILSLESMVGDNIITNSISLESFTTLPSKINYGPTIDKLNQYITAHQQFNNDINSLTTICDKISKFHLAVTKFIDSMREIEKVKTNLALFLEFKGKEYIDDEYGKIIPTNSLTLMEAFNGESGKKFFSRVCKLPYDSINIRPNLFLVFMYITLYGLTKYKTDLELAIAGSNFTLKSLKDFMNSDFKNAFRLFNQLLNYLTALNNSIKQGHVIYLPNPPFTEFTDNELDYMCDSDLFCPIQGGLLRISETII